MARRMDYADARRRELKPMESHLPPKKKPDGRPAAFGPRQPVQRYTPAEIAAWEAANPLPPAPVPAWKRRRAA